MTMNQLQYFITAAKCLNFTEAGNQHFISQTAITQHIQSLEEQLGVKLFNRDKRKVELTPAGEVFLEEAKASLERTRIAIDKTERAARGEEGFLNIGYVRGSEHSCVRDFVNAYHAGYPSIRFNLFRKPHLDLLLQLERKKLDIVFNICYSDSEIGEFEKKEIRKYPLCAVLPASHPYARLSSIRRYDLRNEQFFLTKYYEDVLARRYEIPENFAESRFIPKIVGTSADLETIILLVSAGIGISIMPEYAVQYFTKMDDDVVFIPLEGPYEYISISAIWRKDDDNPAVHKFLEVVDQVNARQLEKQAQVAPVN